MTTQPDIPYPTILPGPDGNYRPCPEILTEAELIDYLRIPEVSNAKNPHNVIENLKRMHKLPCIHISNRSLYPLKAVRDWIEKMTTEGR